jgi:hypothetical protein
MAKFKHNNFLDTVDEVFTDAMKSGVLHLYSEDSHFTGRRIRIGERDLFHFGTTGYLGLEQDPRLMQPLKRLKNMGLNSHYRNHTFRLFCTVRWKRGSLKCTVTQSLLPKIAP